MSMECGKIKFESDINNDELFGKQYIRTYERNKKQGGDRRGLGGGGFSLLWNLAQILPP